MHSWILPRCRAPKQLPILPSGKRVTEAGALLRVGVLGKEDADVLHVSHVSHVVCVSSNNSARTRRRRNGIAEGKRRRNRIAALGVLGTAARARSLRGFGQRRFGWWVEAPARTLLFGKLAPVLSDLLHALLMLHAGILQSKLCHPFFDEEVEGRYPPALRQSPQAAVNPSHGMPQYATLSQQPATHMWHACT